MKLSDAVLSHVDMNNKDATNTAGISLVLYQPVNNSSSKPVISCRSEQ